MINDIMAVGTTSPTAILVVVQRVCTYLVTVAVVHINARNIVQTPHAHQYVNSM